MLRRRRAGLIQIGVLVTALAAVYVPRETAWHVRRPDMDRTEVIRGLRGWTTVPIIVPAARPGIPLER